MRAFEVQRGWSPEQAHREQPLLVLPGACSQQLRMDATPRSRGEWVLAKEGLDGLAGAGGADGRQTAQLVKRLPGVARVRGDTRRGAGVTVGYAQRRVVEGRSLDAHSLVGQGEEICNEMVILNLTQHDWHDDRVQVVIVH